VDKKMPRENALQVNPGVLHPGYEVRAQPGRFVLRPGARQLLGFKQQIRVQMNIKTSQEFRGTLLTASFVIAGQ
jgi:hypothetical protein